MNSIHPLNDNDADDESGVQVSLGLGREPFSPEPAKEYFYAEQTRSQRLKLLHHLAPYGELLIVTGETGSGKTTLLEQFIERAHDTWRLCVIRAHQTLDRDEVLEALAEGFEIQARQGDGEADRLQQLKSHCVALKRKGLLPMVVVDDAHLLTAGALGVLMHLLQSLDTHEKPLRIVLFADPQVREIISAPELEGLQERISHTFNLPPFSEKETANYILHRLKVAGVGGADLFTDTVVAMIHKTSQGQPGKINELAKVVLANKSAGGADLKRAGGDKGGQPAKGGGNIVPLGLALAVLILVVLYLLHNANKPPAGVSEQAPIARNGNQETVPLPLPENTAPAAGGASGQLGQQAAPPSGQAPTSGRGEPSGGAAVGGIPVAPPSSATPPNGPDTGAGRQKAPEPAPPPSPSAAPAPAAGTGQVAGGTEPAPAKPMAKPAPPEPAAKAAPSGSVSKAAHSGAPAGTSKPGGIRDADWLLAQDPKHFTMQVMATHTPANIDRFVHRRGLKAKDFARFQKVSKGKRWHVLIYGAFASRKQAEDRARHLPAAMHGVKPWIRPFADLQSDIRRYRQTKP